MKRYKLKYRKEFKTSYSIYIAVLVAAAVLIAVFIWSNRAEPAPVIIPPPENPAELELNGYTLSWCDDFDGDRIDSSKWRGFRCSGKDLLCSIAVSLKTSKTLFYCF